MKAAVVHEGEGPEQLWDETVPDPTPAPDQVIVELRASALNWHDIMLRIYPLADISAARRYLEPRAQLGKIVVTNDITAK